MQQLTLKWVEEEYSRKYEYYRRQSRCDCLSVADMDMEKVDTPGRVQPTRLLCSTRLGLSIIGFFMFFHLYAQRVGMSVAIVCMVNHTAVRTMAAGVCVCDSTSLILSRS